MVDPAALRADAMVAKPGLDLAFIGQGDLAMSWGVPRPFERPDDLQAVATAEKASLASQVALGGVARTPDQARQMLQRGYQALVFGFDWSLLQGAAAQVVSDVRG